MAIVWIVLAVALVAVELHHFAFFAMFGAIGAAAGALVALLAPSAVPLQVMVALAVTGIGVVMGRPYMSRAFARRGPGVRIAGVHGGLVSSRGITLDEVTTEPTGHVRILGEKWMAVSCFGDRIAPATPVIVVGVTGTTLSVRAADPELELS
jgi:membrane protein implicated in regulation of membrane protease activity